MSKQKKNKDDINDLEERFVSIWFQNGFNATEAYLLAKPGCTYETAKTEGNKILTKPHIQKEVAIRKLAIRNKAEIKLEDLVSTLKHLMLDCVSDDDRPNLIKTIDVLNKMAGFYQQKVDITSNGDKIAINLNLTDKEEDE